MKRTERSRFCRQLARLAGARPAVLWEAFYQVGTIAHHWPNLRTDEKKKIEAAASPLAGFIERNRSRATGLHYTIFDSVAQGLEEPDLENGRNQAKYTVICDTHSTCVCVSSLRTARTAAANPDFCDECRDVVHAHSEPQGG